MGKKGLLTREEEVDIFKEYETCGSEERRLELRNLLVVKNIGLVYKVATAYKFAKDDILDDLVNEGVMGIMDSVDNFNYRKGVKFSTFSFFYIRQKMSNYLYNKIKMIKIPTGQKDNVSFSFSSLDVTNEEGDSTIDVEFIDSFHKMLEDSELKKILVKAVDICLLERERIIIYKRNNLDNDNFYTLEEVGKMVGMTKERVRQIESRAHFKIRKYFRDNKILESYIEEDEWKKQKRLKHPFN